MSVNNMPYGSLLLDSLEFTSEPDGSILVYPSRLRLEEHQVQQLFVWLCNHLETYSKIRSVNKQRKGEIND
jgi:hypothetical protein